MISLFELVSRNLSKYKLSKDVAWSMGSFFILVMSGIVINIAITIFRNIESLGVFNLSYAVYIVISQFAVWGIHYSVLRHAAYYNDSVGKRRKMLMTACAIALVLGFIFALLIFSAAPLAIFLFDSLDTRTSIQYAALGLMLFPLNKVLLAYLNGLREMKVFSLLQGLRYLSVMIFVLVVAASNLPIKFMMLSLLFAEIITTFSAMAFLIWRQHHIKMTFSTYWISKHLVFGTKGLAGGMFAEVNSRIDVILISLFLTDRDTGIYSFVAMLVDGLYHILVMIRINFNPVLVTVIRNRDWAQARSLRILSAKYIFPVILVLSALIVITYYILVIWIVPNKGLHEGLTSLLILLCGVNIVSILVPFDNLMIISGHPGYQAIQQATTVTTNTIFAVALLPLFGIEGAALSTAASYLVGILMLIFFSRRLLGWRLVVNKTPAMLN